MPPPTNKGRKFAREILTPAEVGDLLRSCNDGKYGHRNRAMFALMYRTGLRCAELCALTPRDIDLAAKTINVRRGKGSKQRFVGVDDWALGWLAPWMAAREGFAGVSDRSPLFCTRNGLAVPTANVRRMVARVARDAGLMKRVHPHGFRHTNAAELDRERVPLALIRDHLGHGNISTTSVYLQTVTGGESARVVAGRVFAA